MTEIPIDRLVLYGSLRRGEPGYRGLRLSRWLEYLRPVRFVGVMYDLGGYPGVALRPRVGPVWGELHHLVEPGALADLDAFEGYRPGDATAFYLRQAIALADGAAWIYLYNGRLKGPIVRSGDWPRHVRARGSRMK